MTRLGILIARLARTLLPPAAVLIGVAIAAAGAPVQAEERALVLETIEIEGAFRTHRGTVLHHLPLLEGATVTPSTILDAVDTLRAAEIFADVDFRTARGTERGRFVLHLIVKEKGLEFRFGTGYRDLDGWYVIPAQLRLDNRLGHGERLRLQANLGYRIAGLELVADDPRMGSGGRWFWEAKLAGYGIDRPYFIDGVEYRHPVGRGEAGMHVGRRLGRNRLQLGVRFETVDPDSTPEAGENDPFRDVSQGDPLPFDALPPAVADHVDAVERTVLHAELVHDSRARRRIASTPASGVWGRVRGEALVRQDNSDTIGSVTADVRAYRRFLGGALALRLRGGAVGETAAFYDRFHLGGLYTVRGFPSQSLSPPGGDTRFWTSTLEFRAPLVGRPDRPRVLGFLFVDAGDGWRGTAFDLDDAAAAAGWGIRLRVPWFDSIGVDVGMPITSSAVNEAYHANLALGWNF